MPNSGVWFGIPHVNSSDRADENAASLNCPSACAVAINTGCWEWFRSEPVDAAQDVGKQGFPDCDPGKLECDIAATAYALHADLDQPLAQCGQ